MSDRPTVIVHNNSVPSRPTNGLGVAGFIIALIGIGLILEGCTTPSYQSPRSSYSSPYSSNGPSSFFDEKKRESEDRQQRYGMPALHLFQGSPWNSHGYLMSLHVVQIIDDKTLLARVRWDNNGIETYLTSQTFWISGYPTAGMVDDAEYDCGRTDFKVAGTHQYTSALGVTRTVSQLDVVQPATQPDKPN